MARRGELTAGGSILFLTVLGTLSQLLAFGYRVALSRMVGAEVMGLYQLIMPVYSVLLSLTSAGLTTGVSNLSAWYQALGNRRAIYQVRGQAVGLFLLVGHLSGLTSFRIPYLMPFVSRELQGYQNERDNLFRGPFRTLRTRPAFARREQRIRLKKKGDA